MLKKIVLFFLIIYLTVIIIPAVSNADSQTVFIDVNGQRLYPDVPPFIQNDRTLVPVRGIFEKLGADVEWYEAQQEAVITYNGTIIDLRINNTIATINGVEKQMDVPPMIYNNRTMIPLRFIAENMGMLVQWVQGANLATITDPSYFNNVYASHNTVLGYTTNDYRGDTGSYSSITRYYNNISSIAAFSYLLDTNGNLSLTGESQKNTVQFANSNNVKSLVLIHNFSQKSFDRGLAHSVLSDVSKRRNLIDNIFNAICNGEYAGVNIDIENVSWSDRQNYSQFIKELKDQLAPYGFLTTVSIPAKTFDSYMGDNWSGGFDYSEIGKYADQIMLMTYDEHYFGGSPGSIASYPWVDNVLSYATGIIPSGKLLLGIAGYGYDWASSGNRVITYKNIDPVMSSLNVQNLWDDTKKSPYFVYSKDGTYHEVWYENNASISAKLDLVNKYQLGGIGIWRLGYDNDDFWNAVTGKIKK